jgi:hypothetical protein
MIVRKSRRKGPSFLTCPESFKKTKDCGRTVKWRKVYPWLTGKRLYMTPSYKIGRWEKFAEFNS